MKRLPLIASFMVVIASLTAFAAAPALAQPPPYSWTISSSPVDPFVNQGPVTQGPFFLYLWVQCDYTHFAGIRSAEFALAVPPETYIAEFQPLNGFLNFGDATNLQLAVGSCPAPPVLAGLWVVLGLLPGSFCLVNSANGVRVTENCAQQVWPIAARGFGYGENSSCDDPLTCNIVLATQPGSWGVMKSRYR